MHNICGTWGNHQLTELKFRIVIVTHHFDVIWNASTWDPYRVILLRTRIDPK